jgi:cytochrome bd ubiquinol oxidase subunit I
MNFPFWDVPYIGSSWVIGMIAIFHVMISQFAVGGGLYLVMAEEKARRGGQEDWLPVLQQFSKFFLILTGVFGVVSGVGIWFAIGLVHPEATSTLIHNFVFGWAIEWVFFLIELTAAAVYYYTWDRVPAKLHLQVGWLYAAASVCTLVIINGILTFMLTPGDSWLAVAGTGQESSRFWQGFFNPTYWPSLLMRITVCCALAGVWSLIIASRIDGDAYPRLKSSLVRWSSQWLLPSFILMPVFLIFYLAMVPESQRALLTLGISTIGSGAFSQVTRIALIMIMTSATITGLVYFFGHRSPRDFTFAHALAVLALALGATASGEYAREMLRKPYVIGHHMYSNGVRVANVTNLNANGYLATSMWTTGDSSSWERGVAMYRGQCASCHTIDGYRSLRRLTAGRDRRSLGNLLTLFHEPKPDSPYRRFMPPLTGTQTEINSLADYLYSLNAPQPAPDSKALAMK